MIQVEPLNLWEAFEKAVLQRADEPALILDGKTISFTTLYREAIRCSGWLAESGIQKGDVVALQLPKRYETYTLWLSCLRQGAIYVFLDPQNPVDRTHRILERIRPSLFVTIGDVENPFGLTERLSEAADASWIARLESISTVPEAARLHGLSPAYIMFTSGSTGEPKGAVISHQGVLSLMRWVRSWLENPCGERFSNLNPLHFDNSVFDLYGGLLNGATLVPVETGQIQNPMAWVRCLRDANVSVMFAVPTLFLTLDRLRLLTPESLPAVRHFVFGGEGFPIGILKRFYAAFQNKARLLNVYGPTETSCICSSIEIDTPALEEAGSGFASLGRMHKDFEHVVLNDQGERCESGEPGELWIGGANVGLGYYANLDETKNRFVQDPQQSNYRSIWYRSGDVVREDSSGLLWFLGRVDNQVKIRGHRIELEEIDLALESLSGVMRAVAVIADGRDGPEIYVAYAARSTITNDCLKTHCQQSLPKYMQPTRFVQLELLPQNANGKVDRRAVRRILTEAGEDIFTKNTL